MRQQHFCLKRSEAATLKKNKKQVFWLKLQFKVVRKMFWYQFGFTQSAMRFLPLLFVSSQSYDVKSVILAVVVLRKD